MPPPIEFYHLPSSPPSRSVWMVLEELGVEYVIHVVNLKEGEHRNDDFRKISIRQKVPAIKDGDVVISER